MRSGNRLWANVQAGDAIFVPPSSLLTSLEEVILRVVAVQQVGAVGKQKTFLIIEVFIQMSRKKTIDTKYLKNIDLNEKKSPGIASESTSSCGFEIGGDYN